MKLAGALALIWGCCAVASAHAAAPEVKAITIEGRRQANVALVNPEKEAAEYRLPAGAIFQEPGGERLVSLREGVATLPPGASAELTIPAAALSSPAPTQPAPAQPAQVTGATEPRLTPLLDYLKTRNDVPRGTSQCAVLAILEDISFQQWEQFLAAGRPAGTPEQASAANDALIEALDAIGILRAAYPERSLKLQSDPALKLRALRNPALRAKALQLFGMTIPGDAPTAGAVPPDLGQLLHTKPGDNCPICRMRAAMQRPASDL